MQRMKTTTLSARTRGINAAMKRAAQTAATRAKAAGTRLYHIRDGKIIAERPGFSLNEKRFA